MTREEKLKRQEEFYATCGELLGIDHKFKVPVERKNRWNNRAAGNGRYAGFGTVRQYSEKNIVVTSRIQGSKLFKSEQEVYEYLKEFKNNS